MANLRQNVLRSNLNDRSVEDSDEEWINVVRTKLLCIVRSRLVTHHRASQQSGPGTPGNLSRPQSPSLAGAPRSRLASKGSSKDPLRIFPTELNQVIFGRLSIRDLARCARVSKKWSKSQSINYGGCNGHLTTCIDADMRRLVWFQHYRKENFQDDSLPPGKWTKRESKENWVCFYWCASTY